MHQVKKKKTRTNFRDDKVDKYMTSVLPERTVLSTRGINVQ